MLTDDRYVVPLTLLGQVVVSLVLGGALWLLQGPVAGLSALLGGATAVVPNGFLAARLLLPPGGLMRAAWIGEIGKLLMTALLFGVVFGLVRPLSPAAVFAGFIAAQLAIFGAFLLGGARSEART